MFHQLMGNIWHNCLEQILVSLRKPGFRVQSFSRRHNLQGFWDSILSSFSSSLSSKLLLSFHYKQQSTHPERSITYHACCFMSCPILCDPMDHKLLQSCPTLCDPMDCSQQTPLSMVFSRQEYWTELPCSPPGNLPNPGIKPTSLMSLDWQAGSLPAVPPGKPQ